MKRLSLLSASGALLAMASLAPVALAAQPVLSPLAAVPPLPPAACAGVAEVREFFLGFAVGSRGVRDRLAQLEDCSQIGQLAASARAEIAAVTGLPLEALLPSTRCRAVGLIDGLVAELDNQNFACEGVCAVDGELFGALAAQGYCALAVAFGGFDTPLERQPLKACGPTFSLECDQEFERSSRSIEFPPAAQCLPFTEGPFANIWLQSRANQCAYDPAVGPR